jgi:hypothetical protein
MDLKKSTRLATILHHRFPCFTFPGTGLFCYCLHSVLDIGITTVYWVHLQRNCGTRRPLSFGVGLCVLRCSLARPLIFVLFIPHFRVLRLWLCPHYDVFPITVPPQEGLGGNFCTSINDFSAREDSGRSHQALIDVDPWDGSQYTHSHRNGFYLTCSTMRLRAVTRGCRRRYTVLGL